MLTLVGSLAYNKVADFSLSLYVLAHVGIALFRSYNIYRYYSFEHTIQTQNDLNEWLRSYQVGAALNGLTWGLTFFILEGLPQDYYFIIFSIIVGIASVGLLSVGMIFSVFISFMLPLFGLTALWFFIHGGTNYLVAGALATFGIVYYILYSKKYSKNFAQVYTDKEVIKEYVEELQNTQERNKELKERTDLALKGSLTSVLDWDYVKETSYISPSWKEMLGYSDSELNNTFETWKRKVHKDDLRGVLQSLKVAKEKKYRYFESTHRLEHKDGHYIWIYGKAQMIYDDGNLVRMIGTHSDISREKNIQIQNAQQAQIIKQIHDAVISTDLNGYIVSWNKGAENLLGYQEDEIISQYIGILFPDKSQNFLQRNIKKLPQIGEYHTETQLLNKEHIPIDSDLSFSILKNEYGLPIGSIIFAQDITDRTLAKNALIQEKEKLSYQAHHDTLTGLPNRTLFNDRLRNSIQRSKRKRTIMALLFIDLDHFKKINDSLGHDVGDKVLQEITQILKKTIRKEDAISRLGGDEFTIILDDLNQGQDASILAQKIISAIDKPITIDGRELYLSSSIGISLCPDDGNKPANLLKYADSAMYKAKSEGRNNFQFYSADMTELAFERVVMEISLREAIKNEDFIVFYQAQVDASKNKIVGMEALVRWNHQTMGIVSPDKFIPLAESTGLIIEIDRFVMRTAMTQMSKWYDKGLNPGILAMNLTVKQLQDKNFIKMFADLMQETQCKAEWIELEVTEGQIMHNPDEAIKILNNISEMGIEIAIDDFGTGYSSLAYLKRLPINKLKIDQSFVRNLPDDKEDVAIAKAVISLAQNLNLRVIAEGVETKAQKDFLVKNKCKNIQGYFYAKPLPAKEFEQLLQNGL